MEVIIKIEGFNERKLAREVACDICNCDLSAEETVEETVFAVFWKEKKEIYLEKYVCSACYSRYFSKRKCISFADAPDIYRQALERDFKRDWHQIVVGVSSIDEFQLLIENPALLDVVGEKF